MVKIKILSLLICILMCGFSGYAEDIFDLSVEDDRDISMVVGEISVIKVSYPTRVSVRNPEIADTVDVTDNEIIIVGKQFGDTVLRVWDRSGEKKYYITVYGQDLEKTRERLETLINKQLGLRDIYFKINEATGKVMIMGEVTPEEKANLEKVLSSFYNFQGKSNQIENLVSTKKESKMVEIDCQILEINKDELDNLGIKWQEFMQFREEPYSAPEDTDEGVQTTLQTVAPMHGLWSLSRWSRDAFHYKINMLLRRNKGKVLSRPKLLCLSGEEAKLTVGGEVPYVTASTTNASGTGVSIQYKDYGVILTLRPVVLKDNQIMLNIGTEISEIDWVNAITIQEIRVPAFIKREADTVVNVSSGDTVFLGGLIQNEESKNVDKLPALGSIPLLGALFRSKEFQNEQTELVITLTPVVRESKREEVVSVVPSAEQAGETYVKKIAVYPDYLQEDELLNDYILQLQKMIFNSLDYPRIARDAGWQGAVKIRMHINRYGELIDIGVKESSGYVSFDKNVIKTAKSLSPYPPFPFDTEVEDLWIDIPIVYKMD
ncbi:MAG: TonB family protein [Candidatus Omnitrophica bacterium]|nr:TonB family protein [Candidatus Omnitrophota bacterium]MBD3269590.1 TonB family protein [Candidatus Omnitrophota bacterium]